MTIDSLWYILWLFLWKLLKLSSSVSTSAFPKLSGRSLAWHQPGHNVVSLNEAVWPFLLLWEPVVLPSAHQERSCSTDCLLSLTPQPCRPSFLAHSPNPVTKGWDKAQGCATSLGQTVLILLNVIKGSEGWNCVKESEALPNLNQGWQTSIRWKSGLVSLNVNTCSVCLIKD